MSTFPIVGPSELAARTAESGTVLLDFWQQSCAPCRALEPRLERLAGAHHGEFRGYRIDVDSQPDLVARYNVMTIPTVVVLQDGQEVGRLDGLIRDADLTAVLSQPRAGAE